MALVTLRVAVARGPVWDTGYIEVFVPASDSFNEIRESGVAALRKLATEILAAPDAEGGSE